eukprot:TRINITY_DN67072_c0_g1_i1.p1 TRINITY_DN67072_c0_g1~~TRINITY_DN67072_c0_g1_i1.p1  ORF type:complete len:404 (-),score=24.85 TRINITY_DN67072_c0_g1_i1:587-1798(-)
MLTMTCLVAPYLACLLPAALATGSLYLGLATCCALAWLLCDPIGRELPLRLIHLIWAPPKKHHGVFGGDDACLRPQREAVKRVAATYQPTPWLLTGDQRTISLMLGVGTPKTAPAAPSDFLEVDGVRGPLVVQLCQPQHLEAGPPKPVVLAIGGIVGDPDSPFIQHIRSAAQLQGWGFALWVTRPDLLRGDIQSAPDPTDMRDIHTILGFLQKECPGSPLHLVGYSMGGSMVLLYCARYGKEARCDAGVAVAGASTPAPLECQHYRRYWQPWLTAQLKVLFYQRFASQLPAREKVASASTYVELLDRLPHIGPTSRLTGPNGAFSYDERHHIDKPLLFFASADDAFHHPVDSLGIDDSLRSVLYYITDVGGHCAWPEGMSADCSSFHTRVALAFLEASSPHDK